MPKKGEIDLPKLRYWRSVLSDFEKSGQSGQAYCKEKGIRYTAFANRRRRLAGHRGVSTKKVERTPVRQIEFAEVTVKPSLPQSSHPVERLEIVFPTGTVLRVPNGYSAMALVEIVSVLEGY